MTEKEKQINKINFLFILGVGRSGTTLLVKLLGNSRKCVTTPESRFLLYGIYYFKRLAKVTQKNVAFFFENIFNIKEKDLTDFRLWNITKESFAANTEEIGNYTDYRNVLKEVYLANSTVNNLETINYIVDKNPPYSVFTDVIAAQIPNAKFIFITRDYTANYASVKQHNIGAYKTIWFRALSWNYYNENLLKFKEKNKNVYQIKYEDFVNETEKYSIEIYNFLGLPFSKEMLEKSIDFENNFQKIADKLSASEKEVFVNMQGKNLQNIDNKSNDNSTKNINNKEKEILNYLCSNTAKKLGYAVATDNVSVPFS